LTFASFISAVYITPEGKHNCEQHPVGINYLLADSYHKHRSQTGRNNFRNSWHRYNSWKYDLYTLSTCFEVLRNIHKTGAVPMSIFNKRWFQTINEEGWFIVPFIVEHTLP